MITSIVVCLFCVFMAIANIIRREYLWAFLLLIPSGLWASNIYLAYAAPELPPERGGRIILEGPDDYLNPGNQCFQVYDKGNLVYTNCPQEESQ